MIKNLHTHRWVKLESLFLTLSYIETFKISKVTSFALLGLPNFAKEQTHTHTHTCRPKLKFHNCIQHTILTH
jgi:hypothetical protein